MDIEAEEPEQKDHLSTVYFKWNYALQPKIEPEKLANCN